MDAKTTPQGVTIAREFTLMAAHSPAFAKKAGVPQSVARHYLQADTTARHKPSKLATVTYKPTKMRY